MPDKVYKLSADKVKELEAELAELETEGRKKIFDSLVWLRDLPNSQEDDTFSDVFEDKRFLEKRIAEIKEILSNVEIIDSKESKDTVEVGSIVRVGFDQYEEEFHIVSAIEADPINKKISDESPVGSALLGKSEGDSVEVDTGLVKKKYRILEIK